MALSDAQAYEGDGSTRDFSILGEIPSESHLRVWIDDVLQSSDSWDLLGNTVLFDTAPTDGTSIQFIVSTTGTDFPTSPSDISEVAASIINVNRVADSIGNVDIVADNMDDVIAVSSNIDNVNGVASNKTNIDNVVNNKTNIDTVANNKTNIDTIGENISNVINVSNNIEEVKALNTAIEDGVLPFERIVVTVNNIDELLEVSPSNGDTVIVKDNNRGGTFICDATQSAVNNGGTIFNGWVRQYSGAVNVKWFGAKGDGVTDDGKAFQSALDSFYSAGEIIIDSKTYSIGTQLLTNHPVLIRAAVRGDISSNTNGSGTNAKPRIVWSGVDSGIMYTIKPAIIGEVVWGGGSSGIEWDGANIANTAVWLDNTKYGHFDGKVRNVKYAGVKIDSTSGSVGNFSMKNHVPSFEYIWGTSVATQNSIGLLLGGNSSTVPATQQLVGDVSGLVYNGALVKIAETDNAQFRSIHGVVQSGGLGSALHIVNAGAQGSHHTHIEYCVGNVVLDNGLIGTNILNYNSEGGGISQLAGSSSWNGDLIDYVSGERFISHKYSLRENIDLPAGSFIGNPNTSIGDAAYQWSCLGFSGTIDSKAGCFIPQRYTLNDGAIDSIDIFCTTNGTSGGDYVIEIKASAVAVGEGAGIVTPSVSQVKILSSCVQYEMTKFTFTFPTEVSFTKDDIIALSVNRNASSASDTNTDDLLFLGAKVSYYSDGPNSAGSGTYDIPLW